MSNGILTDLRDKGRQYIFKAIKYMTGASVGFLINISVIYFDCVQTSFHFIRERFSKTLARLHTSAKTVGEK